MTLVSILIVSYNGRDALRECLQSVRATAGEHETLVVDNASSDGSADMVAADFPEVRMERNVHNAGFAVAANQAARAASGDHLVLVNPDATLHPQTVEELVSYARRHPRAGVVGGRLLRDDGSLDPESCWGSPSLWSLTCFGLGLSTAFRGNRVFDPESLGRWDRNEVREVGVVTGCLMLVPRHVWTALGGFDERFWLYSEDVDLATRARAAGWSTVITPDATLTHRGGGSSPGHAARMRWVLKGKATYLRKHWRPAASAYGSLMLRSGVAVRALGGRLTRGPRGAVWVTLWAERATWTGGYPAPSPALTAERPQASGRR